MWRRGPQKRRDDSDPTLNNEDAPAAKRPAFRRDNDADDNDGLVVCELSKNRKVKVRSFSGKILVDIREYYTKDGKELPGKKGISLTMEQWNVLRSHVDKINEALDEN